MADASKRETRLQGQPTAGHSSPPDTVLELSDGTAAVPRKSSSSVIEETEQLPHYPPVWEAGGLTAGLFLALFCTSLDQTVLATAMPHIVDQFQSLEDIGWYSSSYLMAMSIVKMIWGVLYTFYPAKWMFLLGLATFEIGSLICGLAPSSAVLILGRCIAGIGGANVDTGAIVILMYVVPVPKQAMYMSFLGSVRGVTSAAGPPLGGLLTDRASWRWCFYINLPCGAITFLCVWLLFSSKDRPSSGDLNWKEQLRNIDILGTFLLSAGLVSLLLALQWGGKAYHWGSWRIIVLLVASAALLALFCGVQIRLQNKALLPPRVLRNRNVVGATWFVSCSTGALLIFIYYLPIWFQVIKGASASKSGVMLLPTELGMVICSLLGGALVTVVGYYTPFLILSSVTTTIGAGMLSTLKPNSGIGKWLGYQLLLSAGTGLGAQNAYLVAQVAVAKDDTIPTITILSFAQVLSGALCLAVTGSVFQGKVASSLNPVLPGMKDGDTSIQGANVPWDQIPAQFQSAVLGAYNRAIIDMFYVGVALSAISLLGSLSLEFKSIRAHKSTENTTHPTPNTSESGLQAEEKTRSGD